MVMYCPYCDIELNEKQLEAEDGCCPECGAFLSPGMVITDSDEDDEYEDELEGEFNDDEFEDDIEEDYSFPEVETKKKGKKS